MITRALFRAVLRPRCSLDRPALQFRLQQERWKRTAARPADASAPSSIFPKKSKKRKGHNKKKSKTSSKKPSKNAISDNSNKIRSVLSTGPEFQSLADAMKQPGRPARSRSDETEIKPLEGASEVNARELEFKSLDVEMAPIPSLAHGLDRVLFNPGLYHLRDPRSRVFNFDPKLERILPVAFFDWGALNGFVTPSKDPKLLSVAKEHGVKYYGSTSSMSGPLTHFHYLLSSWRPFTTNLLSKGFVMPSVEYTAITKAPTSALLRWNNGVYAMDADKELDSGNILQLLGHSMEKLLTHSTKDFARYRTDIREPGSQRDPAPPEAFRYSRSGNFLIRSQQDAHDPRLPGKGVFDLKTRAVVSIRMDVQEHEKGFGYELRFSDGLWQSYEREYFDMIRSNFIKYSLQVRMGQMDGIFVAFHNVERLFGFQYISLAEMDYILHGQSSPVLGDQEFKLSLELMDQVLQRVTERFPEQSVRLLFETRPGVKHPLRVFAEPVDEESITAMNQEAARRVADWQKERLGLDLSKSQEVQMGASTTTTEEGASKNITETEEMRNLEQLPEHVVKFIEEQYGNNPDAIRNLAALHAIDPGLFAGLDTEEFEPLDQWVVKREEGEVMTTEEQDQPEKQLPVAKESGQPEDQVPANEITEESKNELPSSEDTEEPSNQPSAADIMYSAASTQQASEELPLLGLSLVVRNLVNGQYVERPNDLGWEDKWTIEYKIEEMSERTARRDYLAARGRRYKNLVSLQEARKKDDRSLFKKVLRSFVQRGKNWRKTQDILDSQLETVFFKPREEAISSSPKQTNPLPDVDDYLNWLYSR